MMPQRQPQQQGQQQGQQQQQLGDQATQTGSAPQPGRRGRVVLQLPERDVPFTVRFEREAVARQRQQAAEQARQIADLEADDLSTEETLPSESDELEDFAAAGRLGNAGVFDSSEDMDGFDLDGGEDWY
jgi:hypothetical protein